MRKDMDKLDDELLQRYFDDALTDEERARVDAALTDEDRERLAALGELRGLLGRVLEAESAKVDLLPAIEKRLAAPQRRMRWARMTSIGVAFAAAAAFLLVANPFRPRLPSNECDVESLEVSGGLASVLKVRDHAHGDNATMSIIWAEE
jgi:hypothetical protein